MIDTLHLTLHNFNSYTRLYNIQQNLYNKKNAFSEVYYNKETGEILQNIPYMKYVIFHDKNVIIPISSWHGEKVGSFHYEVKCKPNFQKNIIQFNFSIPKVLYGNNVFQFLEKHNPMSVRLLYKKLIQLILEFFNIYFYENINLADCEIERIDFCYNQIFHNKKESLIYLDALKQNAIKFARTSKNTGVPYDTTLFYKAPDYSFKVYHKGTEFLKNDYQKIINSKDARGRTIMNKNIKYQVSDILQVAERTLRYEITFRKSMLKFLFRQNIFTPNQKFYRNDKFSDDIHYIFFKKLYDKFDYLNRKEMIQKIKAFNNYGLNFCLISKFNYPNKFSDSEILDTQFCTFSEELFYLLHDFFWKKVKTYQIGYSDNIVDVNDKINNFNEQQIRRKKLGMKKEKTIDKTRILLAILLSQKMSIDTLKKYLPPATYSRLKADLKLLGYNPSRNIDKMEVRAPSLDYMTYFLVLGKYL